MSFNKIKAMRSAERHLTNGRIESAISEYKRIVKHDPNDITTQNTLGDLYVKSHDSQNAVRCYRKVAEHYNKQGFAKKAIAVYNKIYKLDPELTEIVGKLGELYHFRGSTAEARKHYGLYAERLEQDGKDVEVLEVWEKLADLDREDPSICLKIARAQRKRNHRDESSKAFFEAGSRLAAKGDHAGAIEAFENALEVNGRFIKAVRGLVRSHIKLGTPDDAVALLEDRLEEEPYNKDIVFLLIDCYFEMKAPAAAEKIITKLVEREPANYPKLLDLVEIYLETEDAGSAVRILSMTSEHLLAGGDARTLERHLKKVLEFEAGHVDALRLLARCYGWQKEQQKLKDTLSALADAANAAERPAEERWALSQFLVLVPHDSERAARFNELVEELGPEEGEAEELLVNEAGQGNGHLETFGLESEAEFASVNSEGSGLIAYGSDEEGQVIPVTVVEDASLVTVSDDSVTVVSASADHDGSVDGEAEAGYVETTLSPANEVRLDEEIESIKFYIEQGYEGLADKALAAIEEEFGARREIVELRLEMISRDRKANDTSSFKSESASAELTGSEPVAVTEDIEADAGQEAEEDVGDVDPEGSDVPDPIRDIASDLGLDDDEGPDPEAFEDHYNRGVVYKEMGMVEEAIREFQDAVECVGEDDDSGRYFNSCTMLGHCFTEKQMPKLALIWYKRAYDCGGLSSDELTALEYELGNALELSGQLDEALERFERVYAVHLDYRDVADRLEHLKAREPARP